MGLPLTIRLSRKPGSQAGPAIAAHVRALAYFVLGRELSEFAEVDETWVAGARASGCEQNSVGGTDPNCWLSQDSPGDHQLLAYSWLGSTSWGAPFMSFKDQKYQCLVT